MAYRIFTRDWYKPDGTPVDRLSRGRTVDIVDTEAQARNLCHELNTVPRTAREKRLGRAAEYEECRA